MKNFAIRRFNSIDSIEEVTRMLHRAFAPMAALGANCQCIDQASSMTRKRMERGDCFVAVADRRIVGTLTLETCNPSSAVAHYRKPSVASLHQFAVDPAYQGAGVGRAMLKVATMWARIRQFGEVSLDTPALALDVRAFYSHQGFRLIQVERLAGREYDSAIMSRSIAPGTRTQDGVIRRATQLAALAQDASDQAACSPHGVRGVRA
jgi:GNAT superfamily N-acetyltransferase